MSKKTQAPKAEKISLDRIFAIVLAAVSVIALFLPYTVVKNNGANYVAGTSLLFGGFSGQMSGAGLVSVMCIVLMLLSMVASATLSIIAFLKEEHTSFLIRIASLIMSAGAGFYALAVPTLTGYITALPTKFDIIALLVAIIGVGIYGWLVFKAGKKSVLKSAAQYGVTLLSTILLVAAVAFAGEGATANIVHIALLVLACIGLVFSQFCVMKKIDSKMLHRVRFIAQLAIALVFCIVCLFSLGLKAFIFSFLGALVAAVPVAENFLNVNDDEDEEEVAAEEEYAYTEYKDNEEEEYGDNEPELEMFPSIPRPKMVPQEEEESLEPPFKAYKVEEYAEAYSYEGGPVAGVELAEEVNPAFGGVNTNGYDFYNCQSFDPFIASLNQEERNQFTELFILRYKGVMPEIPDYVVGGDNREFFRMIFIYLGQYRERIPNGLLNKIYIYSTKIS